jgi:hypothetical protein
MATMPQAAAPMDPSMGAAPDAETAPEGDGGFTVCIHCDAEGKLSVGVEGGEAAAPGAGMDDEASEVAGYTPAADKKEALTMALDLLKSNGKASPGDALGKRLGSAGFASGYEQG